MSSDGLSRRAVLGGTAKVGALGLLGGGLVGATLGDTELVRASRFAAGELDLGLAWEATRNGAVVDVVPANGLDENAADFLDTDGVVLALDDLRPGDGGTLSVGFAVCDNPANVWLRLLGTEAENGFTVREVEVDDTAEPELSRHLRVRLWYDENCDGVLDDDEKLIASGRLVDLLHSPLVQGVHLDGFVENDRDCAPLGKLEVDPDGRFTLDDGDPTDEAVAADRFWLRADDGSGAEALVQITDVVLDDEGEVDSFGYSVLDGTVGICAVDVKGGSGRDAYSHYKYPECTDFDLGLATHDGTAVSHAAFYYCDPEPRECFPPCPEFACIGLDWDLPETAGHEIETDGVSLRVEFSAEQCRWVDDPQLPAGEEEVDA